MARAVTPQQVADAIAAAGATVEKSQIGPTVRVTLAWVAQVNPGRSVEIRI